MAVDLRCPNCADNLGKDTENSNPAYCDACFSGEYPIAPSDQLAKGFKMAAE